MGSWAGAMKQAAELRAAWPYPTRLRALAASCGHDRPTRRSDRPPLCIYANRAWCVRAFIEDAVFVAHADPAPIPWTSNAYREGVATERCMGDCPVGRCGNDDPQLSHGNPCRICTAPRLPDRQAARVLAGSAVGRHHVLSVVPSHVWIIICTRCEYAPKLHYLQATDLVSHGSHRRAAAALMPNDLP